MKYHMKRDVSEWIIVDKHCCTELERARDGASLRSSSFHRDNQEGIYLSKDIPRSIGGGDLLRMKYCPFCGHKFSITDIEEADNERD